MGEKDEILLAIGRLQGTMDGVKDHVIAVSAKADRIEVGLETQVREVAQELRAHTESLEAHGAKAGWSALERAGAFILGCMTLVGGAAGIYSFLKGLKP